MDIVPETGIPLALLAGRVYAPNGLLQVIFGPWRPRIGPIGGDERSALRGRGASGDQPDYDFRREVEDVAAVVNAVNEASRTGAE
jgi:hypothetical protein